MSRLVPPRPRTRLVGRTSLCRPHGAFVRRDDATKGRCQGRYYGGLVRQLAAGGPTGRSANHTDVLGLRALRARRHVELHLVVLFEVPITLALNRAEVHEDVGTALLGDEPVSLLSVEP